MTRLRLLVGLLAAVWFTPAFAGFPLVQHVVIVFQENRTPDDLFHGLQSQLPLADIANSGLNSQGQTITLTPMPLTAHYDLDHDHVQFTEMYDSGLMNGADLIPCRPGNGYTCPPNPQFTYVNPSDVAPYFFIASHYGFANRMFQTNQGPSYPAHQFIFAATSQPSATSLYFAANNPLNQLVGNNGCDAPPAKLVYMAGPNGAHIFAPTCFEHATLTDLIDNPPQGARAGLSWRYYSPTEASIWNAPSAIQHICEPTGSPPTCTGPDWSNGKVVINSAQILTDIQTNNLASVSWVIPTGQESDHPLSNTGLGPSWVASVVNAIGASPYWQNTVILIAWDDWGGFYDHVAPPIDPKWGYYEYGFRVPLLVVSAYTPPGYVSQTTHNFGSIVRFIEATFDLGLIPPRTFADSRSDNLLDFFQFGKPPHPFVPIPTQLPASFFINDKTPPTAPDDD